MMLYVAKVFHTEKSPLCTNWVLLLHTGVCYRDKITLPWQLLHGGALTLLKRCVR